MVDPISVRQVWAHNVRDEIENVANIIGQYNHIAMDTEFPGFTWRQRTLAQEYEALRSNVHSLQKVIQIGISLSDGNGATPPHCSTWQFNFRFNLQQDRYDKQGVDMLIAGGVDFPKHAAKGIDHQLFAHLLVQHRLLSNKSITWITFKGAYDVAYILNMLSADPLPAEEHQFLRIVHSYFPRLYDIKYVIRNTSSNRKGLDDYAAELQCTREGASHQAGSDALLTKAVFFAMLRKEQRRVLRSASGKLFRIGVNLTK